MNSNRTVLSIDIGTSTVKCGVIDSQGTLCSGYRAAAEVSAAADPASAWEAQLLEALSHIASEMDGVEAVSVCGNGPTMIPVGADGSPCGATVAWNHPEAQPVEGTRSLFLPAASAALKTASKDVRLLSGCPEYLTGRITGEWFTFLPSDDFTPYIWEREEAEAYGIPFELFPPMKKIGEPAGQVSKEFSSLSGIPQGIPVFAGGPDYLLALLGTAVTVPGRICDRAGTSEALNLCIEKTESSTAAEHALRVLPHCIEGLCSAASLLPVSGMHFLSFLRSAQKAGASAKQISRDMLQINWLDDSYEQAILKAFHASASPRLSEEQVLSFYSGDDWAAAGRVFSEAAAYSIRRGFEKFVRAGLNTDVLRVTGGQSFNDQWNQLKADVLSIPLEVPMIADAELLGCAAVSLTALGRFSSFQEASERLYAPGRIIEPDKRRADLFSERFFRLFRADSR